MRYLIHDDGGLIESNQAPVFLPALSFPLRSLSPPPFQVSGMLLYYSNKQPKRKSPRLLAQSIAHALPEHDEPMKKSDTKAAPTNDSYRPFLPFHLNL